MTLEVRELSAGYGQQTVVFDASLEVTASQVTVVVGLNGAGKTTLMHSIMGLIPANGEVVVNGQPMGRLASHARVRHGVALVPEGRRVFPTLSVADNLRLGGYTRSARDRAAVMKDVYETFPVLAERQAQAAGLLSGGEQQMLAIGRALMSRPRVVLLDEPTMGLAPVMVDTVMERVTQLADQGLAVLMVEQNIHAALEVTHNVLVMSRGRLAPVAEDQLTPAAILATVLGREQ